MAPYRRCRNRRRGVTVRRPPARQGVGPMLRLDDRSSMRRRRGRNIPATTRNCRDRTRRTPGSEILIGTRGMPRPEAIGTRPASPIRSQDHPPGSPSATGRRFRCGVCERVALPVRDASARAGVFTHGNLRYRPHLIQVWTRGRWGVVAPGLQLDRRYTGIVWRRRRPGALRRSINASGTRNPRAMMRGRLRGRGIAPA